MENERFKNSVVKVDNADKCSGKAKFSDDFVMENMLYARTLRSSIPSGKIKKINLPTLPKDYYFIDVNDVPGENVVNMIFSDWPVFSSGSVNYIGEQIGLLCGPDREKLDSLLKQIVVEYEENAPVYDYSKSMVHKAYSKGDYQKAKKSAKHIFHETFDTSYQEQVYLENQGAIVYLEDGKIVIKASMQCPYYIKKAVMRSLGFSEEKVRVIQPAVGGAFGGKEDFPSVLCSALAVAANKIKRPIKLTFERDEDMNFTPKRHPSTTEMEVAVDENNHIIGLKANISLNGGAFKGLSSTVLERAMLAITNVYTIDNIDVVGDVYQTNTVPCGAFRGFGAPQAVFAAEMMMEHLAHDLNENVVEFKRRHFAKKGDLTASSGIYHQEIIINQLMEKAMEISDFKRKYKEYQKPGSTKGIGMSLFLHGGGFTGNGEQAIIKAKVRLHKDKNDHVHVYAAAVDMGQGNRTTLAKIVADVLKLPYDQVTMDAPDTDATPDSGPTVASRTIMIVGFLLENAAKTLQIQWQSGIEQEIVQHYKAPDYIVWDQEKLQGDAYPAFSWGATVTEVEVSPITYETTIKGVWNVFDVGKVIDERIISGQADGGVVQGLGYGYLENMEIKNGKVQQRNLTDYMVPTAVDVPDIVNEFIDNPFVFGPSGAKGAGELTLVGGAPSVASAIEQAIKRKVNKIPATPEYIMELVNGKN